MRDNRAEFEIDFTRGVARSKGALQELTQGVIGVETSVTSLARNAGTAIRNFTASFVRSALEISIRRESMEAGLRTVLGSAEAAAKAMERIQRAAMGPGLTFEGTLAGVQSLLAAGMDLEPAVHSIEVMGSALAASGKDAGEMSWAVEGLQKILMRGSIEVDSWMQILNRMPAVAKEVEKEFGTLVPAEMLKAAGSVGEFARRFIEAAERVQADAGTTANAISNLGDSWEGARNEFGQGLLGDEASREVAELAEEVGRLGPALREAGGWIRQHMINPITQWIGLLGDLKVALRGSNPQDLWRPPSERGLVDEGIARLLGPRASVLFGFSQYDPAKVAAAADQARGADAALGAVMGAGRATLFGAGGGGAAGGGSYGGAPADPTAAAAAQAKVKSDAVRAAQEQVKQLEAARRLWLAQHDEGTAVGGAAGRWGGTQDVVSDLARRTGLRISSAKRGTRLTASGHPSDHWTGSTMSYATDLVGSTAEMDRAAKQLAEELGVSNYRGGAWLNRTIDGIRYQLGWRVKGHFDHVHLGARRVSGGGGTPYDQRLGSARSRLAGLQGGAAPTELAAQLAEEQRRQEEEQRRQQEQALRDEEQRLNYQVQTAALTGTPDQAAADRLAEVKGKLAEMGGPTAQAQLALEQAQAQHEAAVAEQRAGTQMLGSQIRRREVAGQGVTNPQTYAMKQELARQQTVGEAALTPEITDDLAAQIDLETRLAELEDEQAKAWRRWREERQRTILDGLRDSVEEKRMWIEMARGPQEVIQRTDDLTQSLKLLSAQYAAAGQSTQAMRIQTELFRAEQEKVNRLTLGQEILAAGPSFGAISDFLRGRGVRNVSNLAPQQVAEGVYTGIGEAAPALTEAISSAVHQAFEEMATQLAHGMRP